MSLRSSSRSFISGLCASLCVLSACKLFKTTCDENDRSCFGGGLARSGEACIRNGDCATGMTCRDGNCEYAATTKRGGSCVVSAECEANTYCSSELRCTPQSDDPGARGTACADSSECSKDLVCDLDLATALNRGVFATLSEACRASVTRPDDTSSACALPKTCTQRGTRDFNAACASHADCMPGLYCVVSPISKSKKTMCLGGVKLPEEPITIPTWSGVECAPDAQTPTAYFELAAGSDPAHDFYRLPFPNDIRRSSTGIDLTGHPAPPAEVQPPVAARFVEDAATQDGFSTSPVVYFRFSTAYDGSTLSLSAVRIVNITPHSTDYNSNSTIIWGPPERDSHYICPHWLSLHRAFDAPLRPSTTYAAVVTRQLKTKDGGDFERSPAFEAMLSDTPPDDAALRSAWQAYAPLRAWVADEQSAFKASDLLNAAVFTTADPTAILPQLKAAVAAEGGPGLKSLTVCKQAVISPCEDASGRGACHPAQPGFTEIHGKLTLPIFQAGGAPYEQPENGGGIARTNGEATHVVRHEDVCFALSVPDSPAPPNGYPLLIYAYAVGGVFQEAMGEGGLAAEVARGSAPAAVLSIELPQHGARRSGSERLPQDLVVNFQNPAAMRGNMLQGAADLLGAIALAKTGILARPGDGQPIHFDSKRLALFAQGQGATHAAIALTADDAVRAALLAGVAGHFATTQLARTKPSATAALLPLMLIDADDDGNLAGGAVNPMLSLMQGTVDSIDPINYTDRLFRIDQDAGRDVFVVYGRNDHFSPDAAQEAFAKAAKLQAVKPDLSMHFDDLDPPVARNRSIGSDKRTVALREYDPKLDPIIEGAPEDGHFVVTASKTARDDVIRFLTEALAGETPTIGSE